MTKKSISREIAERADEPLSQPLPECDKLPVCAEERGEDGAASARYVIELPVEGIDPSPYQPRRTFDPAGLEELAASIRAHGVQQPVTVRGPLEEAREGEAARPGYQLIMGERRLRAARLAGLATVPALLRQCSDVEAAELALLENVQRRDLNALEEAAALRELLAMGRTQAELGEKIGRSQSYIANALRLLKLPAPVCAMIEEGLLSPGHGKALLRYVDLPEVCALVATDAAKNNLPCRDIEKGALPEQAAKKALNDKRALLLSDWQEQIFRMDWRDCKDCDHRSGAVGQYAPVCLKPTCAAEKIAARKAEVAAEDAAKLAARAEQFPGAVGYDTLDIETRRRLLSEECTCSDDCPHRAVVVVSRYDGDQLGYYCRDGACFEARLEGERTAKAADQQAENARQLSAGLAALDDPHNASRAMAWLICRSLRRCDLADIEQALAAAQMSIDSSLFQKFSFVNIPFADALAAYPAEQQFAFAAQVLVRDTARGWGIDEELAWFLGVTPPAEEEEDEEPETADEPLPQPLPEAGEGDTCATCANATPFNDEGVKCGIDGYFFDNGDCCSEFAAKAVSNG